MSFIQLINELDFWLLDYTANKIKVFDKKLFSTAKDIVDWVDSNGSWPNDFSNQDAKNLIVSLANQYNSIELRNNILSNIKLRVIREEPKTSTTLGKGFSLYKWGEGMVSINPNKKVKGFVNTNTILYTDTQILDMIQHGIDLKNLPSVWITGIITKAFRIKKNQTIDQTKEYLENASKLLKPISEGGRGGLFYCFPNTIPNIQTVFEQKIRQQYIDKYNIFSYLSSGGKLVNTFYGGSVHTKTSPPDVDIVSYITNEQMKNLFSYAVNNFEKCKRYIRGDDYKKISDSLQKNIMGDKDDPDNIRVLMYCIYLLETLNANLNLHNVLNMGNEYNSSGMITNITGTPTNIFDLLSVDTSTSRDGRLDFVFMTQKAARNGRSIPPETQIQF